MSCDLYCHAILLPCIEFHWNQKIGCSSYGKKTIYLNGSSLPSWILKTVIFGHVTVIEFQICICVPNFIKIRFFIEIWRLHYTRISVILNFMGPIIASLKSPCRLPICCQCLVSEKTAFFLCILGTVALFDNDQTAGCFQYEGQRQPVTHDKVGALACRLGMAHSLRDVMVIVICQLRACARRLFCTATVLPCT